MAKKNTRAKTNSYEHFEQLLDICHITLKENKTSSLKAKLIKNYKDYLTFKENIRNILKEGNEEVSFLGDCDELGANIEKIEKSDIQDLEFYTGAADIPESEDGEILSFCLIKSKKNKVLAWIVMNRFFEVEF